MLSTPNITKSFLAYTTKKLGEFVLHEMTDHLCSVDEE